MLVVTTFVFTFAKLSFTLSIWMHDPHVSVDITRFAELLVANRTGDCFYIDVAVIAFVQSSVDFTETFATIGTETGVAGTFFFDNWDFSVWK